MHNRFDRFAKDVLREAFNTFGQSSTEVDITADSQRADLCFVPAPAHGNRPDDIGVLARIAVTPCLVEPYRQPPGTAQMRDCLRKLLTWQHMREQQAERAPVEVGVEAPAETTMAVLWVLSAGRPDGTLSGFALTSLDGWPAGVYAGPLPALPHRLIVLSELPEARSTLLLRLLGRGLTLRRAVRELAALDPDAWERRHAAPLLVQLRIEIEETRATGLAPASAEEQEIIMTAQEIVESIEKKARDEGRRQGQQAVFVHQFARKLGRELTEEEQASIRQRLDLVGPDRAGDVAFDLGPEAHAAWLADRDAR